MLHLHPSIGSVCVCSRGNRRDRPGPTPENRACMFPGTLPRTIKKKQVLAEGRKAGSKTKRVSRNPGPARPIAIHRSIQSTGPHHPSSLTPSCPLQIKNAILRPCTCACFSSSTLLNSTSTPSPSGPPLRIPPQCPLPLPPPPHPRCRRTEKTPRARARTSRPTSCRA
jgi:hypothetical protein